VKAPSRIHLSPFASVPLATVLYALSAAAVGLSAFPSALLVSWGVPRLLSAPLTAVSPGRLLLFCLLVGGAFYLFILSALVLLGLLMRFLSLIVREGRHPLRSVVTVFWMAMNGVQTISLRLVLPVVPGGWLPVLYYRLAGARIGRDVWLTGVTIIDPAFVSIGDGTVIGGDVVLSAHIAGGSTVTLGRIRIGRDCRIGAHSVICAGAVIGDGATVGVRTYIRRGRRVPAGSYVADLGGLPARKVRDIQGGLGT
jgi:hypothetical protein